MSRTVSVFDIDDLTKGLSADAEQLDNVDTVAVELLSAQVLEGKQIFYNADDSRMTEDGYISCASCHLDGGSDGRTWDFTDRGEGMRITIDLRGRGVGHGRVHWTGNFDEIQDFEHDIRGPFSGDGFMDDVNFSSGTRNQPLGDPKAGISPELDAMAAYVQSLTTVGKSPHRNSNGTMTSDGLAGQALFATLKCAVCHGGSAFTDSTLSESSPRHDVGTNDLPGAGQRLGGPLDGFDTPTVRGLWRTGPYLHDGSAATLLDVFSTLSSFHETAVSTLSAAERDQLVAYLLQIDDAETTAPIAGDGDFDGDGDVDNDDLAIWKANFGQTVGSQFYDGLALLKWQVNYTGPGPLATAVSASSGEVAASSEEVAPAIQAATTETASVPQSGPPTALASAESVSLPPARGVSNLQLLVIKSRLREASKDVRLGKTKRAKRSLQVLLDELTSISSNTANTDPHRRRIKQIETSVKQQLAKISGG
jgi:mono/diheme cytochrome c family protein